MGRMASLDIRQPLEIGEPQEVQTIWPWLLRPADPVKASDLTDIQNLANNYFTRCFETQQKPTLTGLALCLGVGGPTALQRLAQRRPELRWMVSRCLTAVAHSYETMIAEGSNPSGPIFMLKHLPEFDPDDPAGAKPVQYWNEKRELLINARVHGAKDPQEESSGLSPKEVYLRIIHGVEEIHEDIVEDEEAPALQHSIDTLEQLLQHREKVTEGPLADAKERTLLLDDSDS